MLLLSLEDGTGRCDNGMHCGERRGEVWSGSQIFTSGETMVQLMLVVGLYWS